MTGNRPIHRRIWFRTIAGLAIAGVTGSIYSTEIEPGWIDINTLEIPLPNLDAAFDGYRIVQISDTHIDGDWMDQQRLARIVESVNEQEPDLVAITGDFVSGPLHPDLGTIMGELRSLSATDGTFAVLGNHDHWTDAERVRGLVAEQGIIELRDVVLPIRRDDAALHIGGMDALWPSRDNLLPLSAHQERLDELASHIPADGAAVLLVHEPDIADLVAATQRFGLQVSGHSHGGQVRMPVGGAILLPPLGQKYPAGMSRVGSMVQYTNRGVGMISPQVRFNCRPEITVFSLTVAKAPVLSKAS